MANEALVFDADLTPLNWFLNGRSHYVSINASRRASNIWCVGPAIEDWISLTDPSGDIGTLVEMRVTIKNVFVSSGPWNVGVAYHILKSDDTQLGSYGLVMVTNMSPHEYNIVIPLVGTGADTTNMKMRIRSYDVGGWPVGQAVIQTYQILPYLYYTEPVLTRVQKEIEVEVSTGETTLQAAPSEVEMEMSSGEIVLQSAPGAIEMLVSSGEIAIQSEGAEVDVKKEIEVEVSAGETTLQVAPSEIEMEAAGGEVVLQSAPGEIEMCVSSGEVLLQVEGEEVDL